MEAAWGGLQGAATRASTGTCTQPEQIPLDYYSRLTAGRTLPERVLEGGWGRRHHGWLRSTNSVRSPLCPTSSTVPMSGQ